MNKISSTRNFFIFLLLTILFQNCTQEKSSNPSPYNLDFETWTERSVLPDGWTTWGNQLVEIDSTFVFEGRYAGKLTILSDEPSFGAIVYKIPIKELVGDSVSLEAKIRFENISEGFVGLILRVERDGNTLEFDNLQSLNLNGNKDWENYKTSLPLGDGMDQVTVAGIIQGKGTAWFDNFVVKIDGIDIQSIERPKEKTEVVLDNEFDKGSRISISTITPKQLENLALLAKIWAFLKYYHPEINAGNFNWDYELFRILPQILATKNDKDRDQTFLKWINKLGKVQKCKECIESPIDELVLTDQQWIKKSTLSQELKESLICIFENRIGGSKNYVGPSEYGPPPSFSKENAYPQFSYPDDGFRLLALFRYWGIIEYYFPYKHLIDEDWDKVLNSFIPLFINAKNALEYELALLQLITKINDTHASLNTRLIETELRGQYYPPFTLEFVEDKLVIKEPLQDSLSHLKGEVINQFNGRSIQSIIDSLKPYFPASNESALKRDMAKQILRSKEKTNNLTIQNRGVVNIDFGNIHAHNSLLAKNYQEKASFKIISNDIAYLNIHKLKSPDLPSIFSKIKSTTGLIIDLRTYPEETILYNLGAYLIKAPKSFVKASLPYYDTPGTFYLTQPIEIQPNPENFYKGKVILLVNEETQSTSEFHAMAFQAGDNVITIGSQTAGADGNVANIPLPGSYSTFISGVGIYYPDGTETQRVGIKIDLKVKPTIEGIKKGKDEVLEKAIKLLKK